MVTIRCLQETDISAVLDIELSPLQIQYSAAPAAFLQGQGSDAADRYVVVEGDELVGYFKIITDYSTHHDFCSHGAIGLGSFAIDNRCQGKGLGTESIKRMVAQLGRDYPNAKQLYLTVNCRNAQARSCYLNAGFIDTEQLYLGGPVGPQHIMLADLK